MTDQERADLLAALEIAGWPEWQQTGPVPQAKGLWLLVCYIPARWVIARSHQDQVHAWCDSVSIDEPVALALCEHHLLEWLRQLGGVEVRAMEHGHVAVWTNPILANPKAICVSADADTLLAALVAAVLAVGREEKT